jgi:ubiquinone/menaquinone biosynthesis C-methylase UbiE
MSRNVLKTGSLAGLVLPTREEIDAVVRPYITKRVPVDSADWKDIYSREADRERKIYRKQKLRSILPWRKEARPQTLVSDHYETHWTEIPWPKTNNPSPDERGIVSIWDNEGMLIRRYGRKRVHHQLFTRVVRELKPKTALEVGFGNGINLLIMSTLFPEVQWTGVELTEAGVQTAKSIQKEKELPAVLREFATEPVLDPTAHQRVTLQQGDASKLPFKDGQFDLVFSFQALEQMQAIRDAAVSEMSRVAKRWVVCTEPFSEWNKSEIQEHYKQARGYLDLSIDELPKFGLKPILVFGDWPHKLQTGAGLVAAEKV